jgi:hypothetical protein
LAVGDAHALKFADASFDVVISNYMFDLLPERISPRSWGSLTSCGPVEGWCWSTRRQTGLWEWVYRETRASWAAAAACCSRPGWSMRAAGVTRETVEQFGFPSEVIVATKPGAGVL